MLAINPAFFTSLTERQTPEYLWIGCSDSRVPANEIVGMMPGDIFVHRNVANLVSNISSSAGTTDAAGVAAVLGKERMGLIDNWLMHIKDTYYKYQDCMKKLPDQQAVVNKLCELNVIEQAFNVSNTTIVRSAWEKKQELNVHALIYRLSDGILRDLNFTVSRAEELDSTYKNALAKLTQ
ncbi:hypothetical protein CHS0354_013120 [Potamilus streckersoni]|uniref:Carbonic anhydrase n=1 Tax=Potamilus streckersoni TaxID=2493646 RepID=A0AAE0VRB2_9BIVA|nr:hypothetical protein CHS0354_013120 [Potamilus streckersoni]